MRRDDGNMYKGQPFFNKAAFKDEVLDHALKTGQNIKKYRYDTTNIGYICVDGRCSWRVYCACRHGSDRWDIMILNDVHSCSENGECEMIKVLVIARLFMDKIREESDYFMLMKMKAIFREKWKINVSRPHCQSTMNKALQWIKKEYNEQFERLREFAAEIRLLNPNSTVVVETLRNQDGLDVFNRFYVYFDILRRTWKSTCRCRCFLKGKTKGELLVALGHDADNVIYPIAWGVVQVQNTVNWLWFMKKVRDDLQLGDGDGYVLVSDRQKGLIKAVELALPKMEHKACVRHVYANVKSKLEKKPRMKLLIWNLAWSYNEADYTKNMRRIHDYDDVVYAEVLKQKSMTWCMAFFRLGSCCEDMENNST